MKYLALDTARAACIDAAKLWGVSLDDVLGESRAHINVKARKHAIRALWAQGYSTVQIGRRMQRDHTTILHHVKGWRPSGAQAA